MGHQQYLWLTNSPKSFPCELPLVHILYSKFMQFILGTYMENFIFIPVRPAFVSVGLFGLVNISLRPSHLRLDCLLLSILSKSSPRL